MFKQDSPKVSIVDYGMGNLFSVKRVCEHVDLDVRITSDRKEILASDAVILPGVGAFGDAMANLGRLDLISALRDFIESGKPFMAICLGMQLLMSESEEMGIHKGFNVFDDSGIKFLPIIDSMENIKVPQIGWNRIYKYGDGQNGWEGSPLKDINEGEFMYFIHSYYVKPKDPKIIMSITEYANIRYCSSISWKNIFACQFHPERSAGEGIKIYRNFASIIKNSMKNIYAG